MEDDVVLSLDLEMKMASLAFLVHFLKIRFPVCFCCTQLVMDLG